MHMNGFSISWILALVFWFFVIKILIGLFHTPKPTPRTSSQRQLVQDVISAIERHAPDFDQIKIYPDYSSYTSAKINSGPDRSTNGHVEIISGDKKYSYSFKQHNYEVVLDAAEILASEIVKHFGGEKKPISVYDTGIVGYTVTSARAVNEKKERQRSYNERVKRC